jgi:allantoate deiminase
MARRQDALAAAAECVLMIERRCASAAELVGTVGRLETFPGATNVIPGRVLFTADIRSPRDAERMAAAADVAREIAAICARRGVAAEVRTMHVERSAACAPWLIERIAAAIAAAGLPVRALPSGAGHDGMALVDLTDIGMLFVRCTGGVSHNPTEAITVEDVDIAARVFLRFIENFQAKR